jgi:WD40 repeat protein
MGMLLYTYSGHSGAVLDIAWSPDGSRIASAGLHEAARENLVDIWDAFTCKEGKNT